MKIFWATILVVVVATLLVLPTSSGTPLLLVYEVSSEDTVFNMWFIVVQSRDAVVVLEPDGGVVLGGFAGSTVTLSGVELVCGEPAGSLTELGNDTILACLLALPPVPALPSSLISSLPRLGEVRVVVQDQSGSVELKAKPSAITVSRTGDRVTVRANLQDLGLRAEAVWRTDGILLESSLAMDHVRERWKLVAWQQLGGETEGSAIDAWLIAGLIVFVLVVVLALAYATRRLASPL